MSNPLTAPIPDPGSVDAAILNRISVRAFRPDPVPRAMLEEIISISKRAPSGTNTQPWRVYVLTGAARDAICEQVCKVFDDIYAHPELAEQYKPHFKYYPDNWVEPYIGRRRETGWSLYGLLGIEKGDKDKMHAQHRRNFRFFDAPVGLVFTMSRLMGQGSLLDCGTFMQNVMLAARARGLRQVERHSGRNRKGPVDDGEHEDEKYDRKPRRRDGKRPQPPRGGREGGRISAISPHFAPFLESA